MGRKGGCPGSCVNPPAAAARSTTVLPHACALPAAARQHAYAPPPLLLSLRVVMVGDPQQLPATILSALAKEVAMERSLFERLQRQGCPVKMLSVQYRMHPEIRQVGRLLVVKSMLWWPVPLQQISGLCSEPPALLHGHRASGEVRGGGAGGQEEPNGRGCSCQLLCQLRHHVLTLRHLGAARTRLVPVQRQRFCSWGWERNGSRWPMQPGKLGSDPVGTLPTLSRQSRCAWACQPAACTGTLPRRTCRGAVRLMRGPTSPPGTP